MGTQNCDSESRVGARRVVEFRWLDDAALGIRKTERGVEAERKLVDGLGLGDDRDGHFHAGDANGHLCTLACWGIRRKPFHPFFIHASEVALLK
ncbi:MAG: hypothetical protein WA414_12060, partial [Acidobacteriaceae bacterium]